MTRGTGRDRHRQAADGAQVSHRSGSPLGLDDTAVGLDTRPGSRRPTRFRVSASKPVRSRNSTPAACMASEYARTGAGRSRRRSRRSSHRCRWPRAYRHRRRRPRFEPDDREARPVASRPAPATGSFVVLRHGRDEVTEPAEARPNRRRLLAAVEVDRPATERYRRRRVLRRGRSRRPDEAPSPLPPARPRPLTDPAARAKTDAQHRSSRR